MKNIIVFVGCFLLLATCQSKKVKIDFEQKECKSLVLKNATYSLERATCNGIDPTNLDSNTIKIRVNHNNKKSCLENFEINPTFSNKFGKPVDGITEGIHYRKNYKHTDPEVTLTDSYIEIRFTYRGLSKQQAEELRTIKIVLKLANELQSKENFFTLTVPLSCANQISRGKYNVVTDIQVTQSTVVLGFMDYASIDGDIVSVYLNGDQIISKLTLSGSYQYFTIQVQPGLNSLVVFAENEGSDSPNTCQLSINGNSEKLTPDFLTGQAVNINF